MRVRARRAFLVDSAIGLVLAVTSWMASYYVWVVDPEVPSVTAWELRNGAYHLVGEAKAKESLALPLLFPLTIVPARLLN
ncbi:MAG TPA: hypothetical protein VFY56_01310 [Propionibacteriaceae bacterium]|nr:hypothetical protein [Propionibacteriaceae bacterium]